MNYNWICTPICTKILFLQKVGVTVGLLRGVDCNILAQGLIRLIEYSYHQGIPSFPEAHL
jgi:hypothetical protein